MNPAGMHQNNVVRDNNGNVVYDRILPKILPDFASNLKFFFTYQVGHMYFRYFMWNFAGRQNDIQGLGDPLNGNWISGIGAVDEILIGKQEKMPESMRNAPITKYLFFSAPAAGSFRTGLSHATGCKEFLGGAAFVRSYRACHCNLSEPDTLHNPVKGIMPMQVRFMPLPYGSDLGYWPFMIPWH